MSVALALNVTKAESLEITHRKEHSILHAKGTLFLTSKINLSLIKSSLKQANDKSTVRDSKLAYLL